MGVVRLDVYAGNMHWRCGRCGLAKDVNEFHKRGASRQTWCKSCRRDYDAQYWRMTRDERLRRRKERVADRVTWYRELKSAMACTDCSGVFHHAAMHWDHLPGTTKTCEVSELFRRGFRCRTILDEIAKCELVCANCHAVRTFNRSRGVAQPGRAPALGAGGRRFGSDRPDS